MVGQLNPNANLYRQNARHSSSVHNACEQARRSLLPEQAAGRSIIAHLKAFQAMSAQVTTVCVS